MIILHSSKAKCLLLFALLFQDSRLLTAKSSVTGGASGGNPSNSGAAVTSGSQAQAQTPPAQPASPAASSAEGTILAYNAVHAVAVKIAANLVNLSFIQMDENGKPVQENGVDKEITFCKVNKPTILVVVNPADASTLFAPDPVYAVLSMLNASLVNDQKNLDEDYRWLTKPAKPGGSPTAVIGASTGADVIGNISSAFQMLENAIPQTSDAYSSAAADSTTLELGVICRLLAVHRDLIIYTPGILPNPTAIATSTLIPFIKTNIVAAGQVQASINRLAKPKDALVPSPLIPAEEKNIVGGQWYSKYDNDVSSANSDVTSFLSFLTAIQTADSSGATPLSHSLNSEFIRGKINNENAYVLILRCETSIASVRNDRGVFAEGLGFVPWPHNNYYYGGMCAGDYALYDKNGRLLSGGVVRKGISQMRAKDFKTKFKETLSDADLDDK